MEKEVRHVTFQVHGDWFTEFVRMRFWEEKCGLDKIIETIKKSLCGAITDEMCIQLLEGRKKLVGINNFELIDDNENIRPLIMYIREQERTITKDKIIRNIEEKPYNYIDQYACTTSRCFIDMYTDEFQNIAWWKNLIEYERATFDDDVLQNGCTFIDNPDSTAEMIVNFTDKTELEYDEFAKIVFDEYELAINDYREKKIPFKELNDFQQAIVCRNHHYARSNKIEWSYLDEEHFMSNKILRMRGLNQENEDKKDYSENSFKEMMDLNNNYLGQKFLNEDKHNNNDIVQEALNSLKNSEPFDTTPSEAIGGWDGFIDREGNFYKTKPIGQSWFNGTAFCHSEWSLQYLEENQIDFRKDNLNQDAKDYLVDILGWCDITHYIISGNGVHISNPKNGFTKAQEETLFKIFELNKDDMNTYYKAIGYNND